MSPAEISQWLIMAGALFVAIKEAPRAGRVVMDVWDWYKRTLLIPDVYRRLGKLEPPEESGD